jgi:hypothetical protein
MIRNKLFFTLFVSIFFALSFYANEINQTQEPQYQAKVLYTKYKSYPNVIYTKQRFTVSLSLSVYLDDEQFFKISSELLNGKDIELLNDEIIWNMNDDKKYETTLNFKAESENFSFPDINISIFDRNGILIDYEILKKPTIDYRKIAINQKRYSNVIATFLEVTNVKATQFSNDEIMVILEVESENGNLEEFQIAKYENQGLKDIIYNKNNNYQKIYYFVMVPIFEKTISFEYYNPDFSRFITVTVPIELKEELVSTQTNLNPYENDMDFYKMVILIGIVVIFLAIYLIRKKRKYLIISMLVMSIVLTFALPNNKIVLKANEKVYILPTANSTVFKILKNPEEVEELGFNDTKEYKKVLFKNNQIGWVKND